MAAFARHPTLEAWLVPAVVLCEAVSAELLAIVSALAELNRLDADPPKINDVVY